MRGFQIVSNLNIGNVCFIEGDRQFDRTVVSLCCSGIGARFEGNFLSFRRFRRQRSRIHTGRFQCGVGGINDSLAGNGGAGYGINLSRLSRNNR